MQQLIYYILYGCDVFDLGFCFSLSLDESHHVGLGETERWKGLSVSCTPQNAINIFQKEMLWSVFGQQRRG